MIPPKLIRLWALYQQGVALSTGCLYWVKSNNSQTSAASHSYTSPPQASPSPQRPHCHPSVVHSFTVLARFSVIRKNFISQWTVSRLSSFESLFQIAKIFRNLSLVKVSVPWEADESQTCGWYERTEKTVAGHGQVFETENILYLICISNIYLIVSCNKYSILFAFNCINWIVIRYFV